MAERGRRATLQSGGRRYTASLFVTVTPEELLEWMAKGEMFSTLTGEAHGIGPLGRSVKDQMIKSNVTGREK
jgi:hypothetical protein